MNSTIDFRQAVIVNTLRSCPLFAGLPANDIHPIAEMTIIKRLTRGQCLFTEGAPVQGLYVVQSGAIKLSKFGANGHEQVIHMFRCPESLADDMLLSQTGYAADARATETSQVLLVQKTPFLVLLKHQSELGFRLVSSITQHVHQLVGLLQDLTCKDVQTRLGDWLLQHCPNPDSPRPQTVELQVSKRILASELGICGETLSRTLTKFRQRNFLSVDGRTIVLLSPMRFSEWLHNSRDPDSAPA